MSLNRFYDAMEKFNDDERVAAFAIQDMTTDTTQAETIYCNLLNGEINKWIPYLETIIKTIDKNALQEWVEVTTLKLDMQNSSFWSCGDDKILERMAWKLKDGVSNG